MVGCLVGWIDWWMDGQMDVVISGSNWVSSTFLPSVLFYFVSETWYTLFPDRFLVFGSLWWFFYRYLWPLTRGRFITWLGLLVVLQTPNQPWSGVMINRCTVRHRAVNGRTSCKMEHTLKWVGVQTLLDFMVYLLQHSASFWGSHTDKEQTHK